MALSVSTLDERSDAELISAVRAGDVASYGELFSRHVGSARRLARQLVPGPDVDDLVSESFAKVLGVLQRGGGPDLAFRAYLLTAVRRLHVDRIRASSRLHTTDDLTPFDPGVPFKDTAVEGFENAAAARAFALLPERWQLVLWHTEVEGQKPADVAPLLGMTPNAVSALAYRAREGLRQAYLSMHARDVADDACERTRGELGAYVRGGLSRRDAARVERHLADCRACTALYLELLEVNSNLRGVLAPLLLGGAAAAYLAGSGAAGGTAVAGLGVALGRAKDLVLTHAPTAAVAGVAASAVVAGLVVTMRQDQPDTTAAGERPTYTVTPPVGRVGGLEPVELRVQAARHRQPAPRPGRHAARTAQPAGAAAQPIAATSPAQGPQPGPTAGAAPRQQPGPSSSPAPSQPQDQPQDPRLVDLRTKVKAGPTGVEVGLGLDVAGTTVVPDTTLGVPAATAG